MISLPELSSFFAVSQDSSGDCSIRLFQLAPSSPDRVSQLSFVLAMQFMHKLCEGAPLVFNRWFERLQDGPPHPDTVSRALEVYLKASVGMPDAPAEDNRLEATVAEHLWYGLQRESQDPLGHAVLLEGPGLRVTDPGGDGLSIHERSESAFLFRLWEVKKRTPSGELRPTVSRAFKQLEARGAEYLVRYSTVLQNYDLDRRLRAFVAQLVVMWIEASAEANAGVAVGTCDGSYSDDACSRMPTHLPSLTGPDRLAGLVVEVGDFADFAQKIRRIMWKGL